MLVFLVLSLLLFSANTYAQFLNKNQLPLRTQGRWIVDKDGKRVKLSCVNWHGAHMNTFVPSGLHFQTSKAIAKRLHELGFNCVRLNWSVEMVRRNPIVHHDAIRAMREAGIFKDLTRALEVMDRVIADLASEKVMTIIDNHMSNAGWCCDVRDMNGLWFNEYYPVDTWEETWEFMAARYADNLYVIGADLRNEIRPDVRVTGRFSWISLPRLEIRMPTWGGGDRVLPLKQYAPEIMKYSHPYLNSTKHRALFFTVKKLLADTPIKTFDWHAAAERCANKIVAKNPNVLIFAQGTFDIFSYTPTVVQIIFYYLKTDESLYRSIGHFFDIPDEVTRVYQLQNLTGINELPIALSEPNRMVYSSHIYPFFYDSAAYKWDGIDPTFEDFSNVTDTFWGYIFKNDIAPVWVGETGTDASAEGVSAKWTDYNLRYLKENDLDFAYWPIGDSRPTINPITGLFNHGSDRFALLSRQYDYVKYEPLYETLKPILKAQHGPGIDLPRNRSTVETKENHVLTYQGI